MFLQSLTTVADLQREEEFKRRDEKWQELLNQIAVNAGERVANFFLKVKDAQQRNVQWKEDQSSQDNTAHQERE
jgi:hypothetical protein